MGAAESKPINLIFPSHGMPFTIPFSEVPKLGAKIEEIINDMELARWSTPLSALDPERPGPGDWVLVDIAKAVIICGPFLKNYIVPGGDYMVLSMRSSAITKVELVEKLKALDMKHQTSYFQMGCLESPVKLRFPSHEMPFFVPYSFLEKLGLVIDVVLSDMERARIVLSSGLSEPQPGSEPIDLGRPNFGDWVLVDVANATIIHRLFIKDFVVPSGDYMVLPMRASVLSEEELLEKVKASNFERQVSFSQTRCSVPRNKLIFPSHGMPFVIPVSIGTGIVTWREPIINAILKDMVENGHSRFSSSPTTEFSRRQQPNGVQIECPTPNDWVLVDTLKASVIHKSFLDSLVVPGRAYMVLPMGASITGKAMKEATKTVTPRWTRTQQFPAPPSTSAGVSNAWSSGTFTRTGSVSGGEGSYGWVRLEIKRLDQGRDIVQHLTVPRLWTIHLLMASLGTSEGSRLVEGSGNTMVSYPQSSRKTLEEIGWDNREGVVKISVSI